MRREERRQTIDKGSIVLRSCGFAKYCCFDGAGLDLVTSGGEEYCYGVGDRSIVVAPGGCQF